MTMDILQSHLQHILKCDWNRCGFDTVETRPSDITMVERATPLEPYLTFDMNTEGDLVQVEQAHRRVETGCCWSES